MKRLLIPFVVIVLSFGAGAAVAGLPTRVSSVTIDESLLVGSTRTAATQVVAETTLTTAGP